MKLFDEIQSLIPYLVSIRIIENVISIDVSIPSDWKIPKRLVDEKSILEDQSPDENFRFFSFVGEITQENFTNLYASIKNIIKYNKDREEKEKLFQEKVNELKSYFDKQSLDEIKKIKFNFDNKTAQAKTNTIIEEEEVK
jgi:hypothetical protein